MAAALFPGQADGGLLRDQGVVVGSRWIAQPFVQARYFHPRPSAAGAGYDALASGGANLSPSNPRFAAAIGAAAARYRQENGLPAGVALPMDAVTRSGSGLDPHISPENAALQVARVARTRGLAEPQLRALVAAHVQGRQLGFLGEPRIDVLDLNLALDRAQRRSPG
jgi:K+-transporting ATPase ATPase C chain